MFDYTQSKFWGGPWYSYTMLTVISLIGGLFGLDHLWLRSPLSAFLKFIVNILTLGLWYFYDLLQLFGEKESVMKNGLGAPFVGPLGIGAGMFVDSNPNAEKAKAPYYFLLYMFLLWVPFGLDFFIAGNSYGALAKAFCTVLFLLWPIAFIWGFVNIGRAVFTPKTLFTQGTYHMFPVSMFLGTNGPSTLGPTDVNNVDECGSRGLLLPTIAALIPGFVPATSAVSTAVMTGANAATVALTASKAAISATEKGYETVLNDIIKPATKMLQTGAQLGTAMSTMPGLPMKGGGVEENTSGLALLALFTVLIGGGTLMAVKRMNLNDLLFNKQKDNNANDSPPEPSRV